MYKPDLSEEELRQQAEMMQQLIDEYKQKIRQLPQRLAEGQDGDQGQESQGDQGQKSQGDQSQAPRKYFGRCILLTGTTGVLGSYILEALLHDATVSHIFCLNRGANSMERHIANSKKRNADLSTRFRPQRVTFLSGDLTAGPGLGLDAASLAAMADSLTHVIHCAWMTNYAKEVTGFRPSLDGIISLVGLCAQSRLRPSMLFLSSKLIMYRASKHESVGEELINKLASASNGYGSSKIVGEYVLNEAALVFGLAITSARVTQLATPVNSRGRWNGREWWPMILAAYTQAGLLPRWLEDACLDWMPIDVGAQVVVEIGRDMGTRRSGYDTVNVCHPSPVSWERFMPVVKEVIEKTRGGRALEMTDVEEANKRLAESQGRRNPFLLALGVNGLPWLFKGTSNWQTQKAQAASQTLRCIEPTSQQLFHKWATDAVASWKDVVKLARAEKL